MWNRWIRIIIHCSLTTAILFHLKQLAHSTCCRSNTIVFHLANETDDCRLYKAESVEPRVCLMSICDDGTPAEDDFCGRGLCNFIGCNCEGGCRIGDPLKKFHEIYDNHRIRGAQLL